MGPAIVVGLAVALFGVIAGLMVRENGRRKEWFLAAHAALGTGWSAFAAPEDLSDGQESRGKLDDAAARFWADPTTTNVRLDVPPPAGVDAGAVYNLVVRDAGGAVETGRETIRCGFDDEAKALVFRGPGLRHDAAASVRALLEEARTFRQRLPELVKKHGERRQEIAQKTFGPHTRPDGRHALCGLALALPAEEWELSKAGKDGSAAWERFPADGEAPLPCELRLALEKQDPALADAGARDRLVARLAQERVAAFPDGAFDGPAPDVHGDPGAAVASHPTARVVVDHAREVEREDGEAESRPYRATFVAIFAPRSVVVLELVAPRDSSDALLERLLASASFEKP